MRKRQRELRDGEDRKEQLLVVQPRQSPLVARRCRLPLTACDPSLSIVAFFRYVYGFFFFTLVYGLEIRQSKYFFCFRV